MNPPSNPSIIPRRNSFDNNPFSTDATYKAPIKNEPIRLMVKVEIGKAVGVNKRENISFIKKRASTPRTPKREISRIVTGVNWVAGVMGFLEN